MNSLNKDNPRTSSHLNMKKDILHRIEKVQENKILRTRENNIPDFEIEKSGNKNKHFQIDFDQEIEDVGDEEDFYIAEDSQQISHGQFFQKKTQGLGVFCFDQEEAQENQNMQMGEEKRVEEIFMNKEKEEKVSSDQDEERKQIKLNEKCSSRKLRTRKNTNDKQYRKNTVFEQNLENEEEDSESSEDEPIRGVTITSNPLQGNVTINIVNKKELVQSPLPPGIVLKCIIRRSPTFLNPQFDMYLHNGLKHLLAAKKYSLAKNEVFKIYSELGKFDENHQSGTIIANTVHNIYWLGTPSEFDESEIKSMVCYEKLAKDEARKMKVHLIHKQKIYEKIKKLYYENQTYLNKYNPLSLQSLNLGMKQNSIKNFILIDDEDKQYEYLKMIKTSDNMFEILIQHPLSPIQAFAIALTRFDAELK